MCVVTLRMRTVTLSVRVVILSVRAITLSVRVVIPSAYEIAQPFAGTLDDRVDAAVGVATT
jgi:hypothetical protein